jgi:hypothetical protein
MVPSCHFVRQGITKQQGFLFLFLFFCGEFSSFCEKHFWNKNSLPQMPCFLGKFFPGKTKK